MSNVITINTLPINTDEHNILIRYCHERDYHTENNSPRENYQDFHLSISAICHVSDIEQIKKFNKNERYHDEKLPVPRKASLCELVKRPDTFGGGNVCKVQGHNNIELNENSYLILALYD